MILLFVPIFALSINKNKLEMVLGCSKIATERYQKEPTTPSISHVDPALSMQEFIGAVWHSVCSPVIGINEWLNSHKPKPHIFWKEMISCWRKYIVLSR